MQTEENRAMLYRRLEEAALNAWPALQQMLFDGWLIRFAHGYTRRANSVHPFWGSYLNLHRKVEYCEKLYAARNQPAIFRLTRFAVPPELDRMLAERGYTAATPTLVLYQQNLVDLPNPHKPACQPVSLHTWVATFDEISGQSEPDQVTHQAILKAIPARLLPMVLKKDGMPVACALGVLEHDLVGIFDVLTAPHQRNNGYATQMVHTLLKYAQTQGARRAYLQVACANAPARHLYTKLAFHPAYLYWYRIASHLQPHTP